MAKFLVCFLVMLSTRGYSQQLFQDASGNTKLFFHTDHFGWIYYNTSDKSASLGYTQVGFKSTGYDWEKRKADIILGGDLKINTKDGIGNIFSKDKLNPGFTLSGNLGLFTDDFLNNGHFLNVFIRPKLSYKQYSFINNQTPSYLLEKVNKVESAVLFNYNVQFNGEGSSITNGQSKKDPSKKYYIFVSIQSGFSQVNNYDDLDDGQIVTVQSMLNLKSIETVETGKLGQYEKSNTLPLNLDFAWTPRLFKTNYIGFNTYYRTNFFKQVNTSNAGIGVYIADPKKPSQISGGIGWQFNDIYDRLLTHNDLLSRSSIFFYIGYAIGPNR